MTDIESLRSQYLEQFTNILRGAYKAGRNDAVATEERINAVGEKAYIAGVEDAFIAVQRLEQMTVTQIGDCLGVYENTLEHILPQVNPITVVRKINAWSEKPHWIPCSDSSCKWANSECSKCRQGGFSSWSYCPNCGSKMEGVEEPDD